MRVLEKMGVEGNAESCRLSQSESLQHSPNDQKLSNIHITYEDCAFDCEGGDTCSESTH